MAVQDLSPSGDPIQNLLGQEASQSGTSNGVPEHTGNADHKDQS